MNNDLRLSVDAIIDGMKHTPIRINEGDFIIGDVELSDTQMKQLFMVLSQVLAYKKMQGTLQGYKPTFDIDKVKLNELDPFGGISKTKEKIKSKLGSKEAKMTQIARESAQKIWDKWESESITGSISSTIENIGNWLKKEEFDLNLLDFVFKTIGVPNVKNIIKTTPEEPEVSEIMKWLEDEMIQPGALTGIVAKEYLLDKGVPEERANKMLDRIGVKVDNAQIVSSKNRAKLDIIVQKFGGETQDDATAPEGEPTDAWPASKVYTYVLNKYDTDSEKLKAAFEALGTSNTSEEPMGDEAFRRLMSALSDVKEKEAEAPQDTEAVMDKTQEIMKDVGASIGKAKSAGQKAVNTGNYAGMTELQKLGIAILTARKKI